MSMTPVDTNKTIDYVSRHDPDKDNPTVWKLGVLDVFQWGEIEDVQATISVKADQDGQPAANFNASERDLMIVRYGLKGITNFGDFQFKTKKVNRRGRDREIVADEFLGLLHKDLVEELAEEIERLNTFGEDQAKN